MKTDIELASHIPVLSEGVAVQQFSENHYLVTKDAFHLRINKHFYSLFSLVNGNDTISKIKTAYNNKFETQLNDQLVYQILYDKLGEFGVFKDTEDQQKEKEPPNYLKLNMVVFSSESVGKATQYLGWLFDSKTIKNVLVICTLILVATIIGKFALMQEYFTSSDLITASNVMVVVGIFLVSGIFHELGHASACSYFGAKHGGVGFGFYLLSPVLFADVSDAWRLDKTKRIIVNLGGIYFELIFTAAIVCLSLLFGNELYILAIILFLKTLFNLNPFFRTDGYWILSDYFDVPNLRETSENVLKNLIFRKKQKHSVRNWLLGLYASFSFVMISIFLAYVLVLNPSSLVTFPYVIADLFTTLIQDGVPEFAYFSQVLEAILLPFFFYYLLFKFAIQWIKKKKYFARISTYFLKLAK